MVRGGKTIDSILLCSACRGQINENPLHPHHSLGMCSVYDMTNRIQLIRPRFTKDSDAAECNHRLKIISCMEEAPSDVTKHFLQRGMTTHFCPQW